LLYIIVSWLISALAIWIVAQIIPGIQVRDYRAALIAAIMIAIFDFLVGPVLRFIAFPITFLTLGLFQLVINALLLKLASMFTPGFKVNGFLAAFLGSIVLTILEYILRAILL
jgi:putative membrane protein